MIYETETKIEDRKGKITFQALTFYFIIPQLS